jgi:hypothetical protein
MMTNTPTLRIDGPFSTVADPHAAFSSSAALRKIGLFMRKKSLPTSIAGNSDS